MNRPVRLSRNTIKYTAVIAMTCNHIANALLTEGTAVYELLTDIGYFTALAMTFLLAEGYRFTSDLKKYKGRLFVFGLLSQIPYYLAFGYPQANIMFTLLICLYINQILDTMPRSAKRSLILMGLTALSVFCDWACIPALFTIFLSRARDRRGRFLAFVYASLIFGGFNYLSFTLPPYGYAPAAALLHAFFTMIAPLLSGVVCLYLYDGGRNSAEAETDVIMNRKGGHFNKWFFYIYYPAHLTVLAVVKYLIFLR